MQQVFEEIKVKTNGQGFYNFTKSTLEWLNKQKIKNQVVYGDGGNVDKWAKKAVNFLKKESVAISLWFLIHEITDNSEKILATHIKSWLDSSPLADFSVLNFDSLYFSIEYNNPTWWNTIDHAVSFCNYNQRC